MAMLFDQPLDDFSIEDPFGYNTNSSIIDPNFWDNEEVCRYSAIVISVMTIIINFSASSNYMHGDHDR